MSRRRGGPKLLYDVQLDLHGLHELEALAALEKSLFANPASSILVIHGRGEGILRKAVRDRIRNPRLPVKSFSLGEDINAPGLDGVTVVHTK